MKYTIEGFSQEEALKIGLDVIDLVLLRWIIDFSTTGGMETRYFEDRPFFWIHYGALLRDMPILGISNSTSLGRRFKRMVKSGLLEFHMFQTRHGSKSFYGINKDILTGLISKKTDRDKPLDSKVKRGMTQKSSGACSKSQVHIDPNTRDPNTNDQNTNTHVFFDYFCLKTKKQFKLTPEDKRLIEQRFGEGYTLDQLKKAVDSMLLDPWPDRINRLDLIYCIGKQRGKPDALEKWLNFTPTNIGGNTGLKSSGEAPNKIILTETILEQRFGRIATKQMIQAFLREIPQNLWWKVDQYLRRRYPGSNGSTFAEAERELIAEARAGKEQISGLIVGIGAGK